jgi:hypothetical protein
MCTPSMTPCDAFSKLVGHSRSTVRTTGRLDAPRHWSIDSLEDESRVVLGGDVWLASNGTLSPTGDNWFLRTEPS